MLHCRAQGMQAYAEPGCIMAASMVNRHRWVRRVTAKELRKFASECSKARELA